MKELRNEIQPDFATSRMQESSFCAHFSGKRKFLAAKHNKNLLKSLTCSVVVDRIPVALVATPMGTKNPKK